MIEASMGTSIMGGTFLCRSLSMKQFSSLCLIKHKSAQSASERKCLVSTGLVSGSCRLRYTGRAGRKQGWCDMHAPRTITRLPVGGSLPPPRRFPLLKSNNSIDCSDDYTQTQKCHYQFTVRDKNWVSWLHGAAWSWLHDNRWFCVEMKTHLGIVWR